MWIKLGAEMNRIPMVCVKTLVCLFVVVQCTGCSHLAGIYSRLNHNHKHKDDSDKYPLDKLMNRLGYNSSRDAHTPSNFIESSVDRYSKKSVAEMSTSMPSSAGNALWKKRSVSGQKPQATGEETKDPRRKKFDVSMERRLYDYSDEEEEDEDEPMEDEMETREYQDLDPYSYDADHRNVRHGASYMRFEQSEPSQHQKTSQQLSPVSAKKWELMGTPKKVDELFQATRKSGGVTKFGIPGVGDWVDQNHRTQAFKHLMKITEDGKCLSPRPKLIKVSDFYPSMTKSYIPECTILHRCGDDTGCCPVATQKCTAINSTTVELFFTIRSVGTMLPDVKKLTFKNDTECQCVEMMPRDMELERLTDRKKTGCTCPTEFHPRYTSNGLCTCDCFDRQNGCLRYKKGLEYFEYSDKLCIAEGRCEKPLCRFGEYKDRYGRCPKREETFLKCSKNGSC